jgi:hypothetical protein
MMLSLFDYNNPPDKYGLDRSVVETAKLTDKPNDRQYWLSKTPDERFEALEILRQIAYGYDPATERLQRVFEIIPLRQG